MERRKERRDWSDLPSELLEIIFQKLTDCADISQCAAVCVSWRSSITILYNQHQLKPILAPFIFLSNVGIFNDSRGDYECLSRQSCVLLNFETKEIHKILLPELSGRWFSSSSYGWLLTIGFNTTENICLLNPFTRVQIKLPPAVGLFHFQRLRSRVITSTSPLDPNCLFVALHGNGFSLAFCRQGDSRWTKIQYKSLDPCNDIIFYKGNFYAIDIYGSIYLLDLGLSAKAICLPIMPVNNASCNYLVELKGDLLLVIRFTYDKRCAPPYYYYWTHETHKFVVYRFDWRRDEWIKVENIGDMAILLGNYNSISLVASHAGNFKGNRIYVIDDSKVSMAPEHDAGVYDMATQRFEWLYQSSPIWTHPLNWFKVVTPEIQSHTYSNL